MVIVSAAFRREKNPDWSVKDQQHISKVSSLPLAQQDYKLLPLRTDVDASSTATLTSDDCVWVQSQQDHQLLRGLKNFPPRTQSQPSLIVTPRVEATSLFYGASRLPPPPPPPPPLSPIASFNLRSNVSPMTNAIPRTESYASSSHNSLPLPAHAHWQSLRRFVVLSRSPEDHLDAATFSSYWTNTAPKAPIFPKPKSHGNTKPKNVNPCDDDVAGLTLTLLDSITSLCVGDESRQSNRRRQQQQQPPKQQQPPSRKFQQYAPPPPYGFHDDDDDDDVNHSNHDENSKYDDGLSQLSAAAVKMRRQQPRPPPPTWSYRKSIVYPIASYPARLNSKTLVEQRRQELKQNSFFRPISDDEASIQQPPGRAILKPEPRHSF